MNKNILIAVIIIVLAIGGWLLFGTDIANGPDFTGGGEGIEEGAVMEDESNATTEGTDESSKETDLMPEDEGDTSTDGEGDTTVEEDDSAVVISFTGTSFSPSNVEISVGDTVTFKNDSSRSTWPASNIHPTHTVYPGSSIGKCGTDEADTIFDACRTLDAGESYSFTFNEVGEWGYHDHLRPSAGGEVTVTE